MESISDIIERKGGYTTVGELSSDSEYRRVLRAVERGEMQKIRHGVYANADALASTMIDVERIVPRGVLCLYSAFSYYNLSTQIQGGWCIAIERKRKIVLPDYPIIDLYYWMGNNLEFGIVTQNISGFDVRITDLERTVCDAVKYRNKIGMDVCGEILNSYLKREDKDLGLLHEYARKLRVDNVLTNYLVTRL